MNTNTKPADRRDLARYWAKVITNVVAPTLTHWITINTKEPNDA